MELHAVVVGAGPAGLAAALTFGRMRRRVLVVDAGEPRNRYTEHLHNFPTRDGVSPLEYRIGRPFVRLDTFAMVNLIAGERIVPELIQDDFTPEAVAREAVSLLMDPQRVAQIRQALAGVRRKLGAPGASRRAAEAILRIAERTII